MYIKKMEIDSCFKFKLDGKRLLPTKSLKHLGVLLDEQLRWNEHIAQVKMKLKHAIGILSKLRYNANLSILKIIHHSLFGSHPFYGSQICGQKNLKTQPTFQTLCKTMPLRKLPLKNTKIILHVSIK